MPDATLPPLGAHVVLRGDRYGAPDLAPPTRRGTVAGYGTVHHATTGQPRSVVLVALEDGGDALAHGGWVSILVVDPSVLATDDGCADCRPGRYCPECALLCEQCGGLIRDRDGVLCGECAP